MENFKKWLKEAFFLYEADGWFGVSILLFAYLAFLFMCYVLISAIYSGITFGFSSSTFHLLGLE